LKRRWMILMVAIFAIGGGVSLPRLLEAGLTTAYLTLPASLSYSETVKGNGKLEAAESKKTYLSLPVCPAEVLVEVGDFVEEGQLLAVIDRDRTLEIFSQLLEDGLSSGIPAELEDLLAQYLSGGELPDLSSLPDISSFPTCVYAERDGVITAVGLKAGSLSNPKTAAFVISDPDRLQARITVNEREVGRISVGDRALIRGSGLSGSYEATVTKISAVAKKESTALASETVVDVLLLLDGVGPEMKPGFTLSAEIWVEDREDVLFIPYEAISSDREGKEYVYLYRQGKAVRQRIQTGAETSTGAEVLSGLTENDLIICNPGQVEGATGRLVAKNWDSAGR